MARNDNPRDPYEVALDISLIATDRVQRTVMRRDVVLERARLAMRRAEAALISAKYGSKERDAEMREATRHQAERFTRAFEVAERSYVEPVDVGDDEVVIHGIVHGAKGHKLEVHALGPGDRSLATGTTNEHGYFKLSSDAEKAHEAATTTRLPASPTRCSAPT